MPVLSNQVTLLRNAENSESYTLVRKCSICKKQHQVLISSQSLFDWQMRGKYAQDAFSYLTDAQREMFFFSGMCGKCWDDLFSSSDDDDEDTNIHVAAVGNNPGKDI